MAVDIKSTRGQAMPLEDARGEEESPLIIASVYIGTKAEQKARAEAQIRLLDEWTGEDPEDDEQTLAELKKALNESRRAVGARLLFPEEEA
jgi:hypothetical protein